MEAQWSPDSGGRSIKAETVKTRSYNKHRVFACRREPRLFTKAYSSRFLCKLLMGQARSRAPEVALVKLFSTCPIV